MKALVIANGNIEEPKFYRDLIIKEDFDFIVCADGGIDFISRLNVIPNLAMGDFDSISSHGLTYIKKHKIPIEKFGAEKDETDTEIVLDYLIDKGFNDITLIGCIGSRLDHTLANIYLLKKLLYLDINAKILNQNNKVYLINQKKSFINNKGDIVSLLPLTDTVKGITTLGLYYPLHEAELVKEKPLGISNIIMNNYAEVCIKEGELLIFISKD